MASSTAKSHSTPQNNKTHVIIYDPDDLSLKMDWFTEDELKSTWAIPLPRLSDHVSLYADGTRLLAQVNLSVLGPTINWQRRLGHKYKFLYVKGVKSE